MTEEDRRLERLQEVLSELDAREDVEGLVDAARADATTQVRQLLTDAYVDVLLERATAIMEIDRDVSRRLSGRAAGGGHLDGVTTEPPRAREAGPGPPVEHPSTPDPGEPHEPSEPSQPEPREATYVYGVVPAGSAPTPDDVPALPGGRPVRTVEGDGCTALVASVDPSVYRGLEDPDREDLELLATAASAHDAVLLAHVSAPVLPLPFGTVLADDGTVAAVLERHRDRLEGELARLRGLSELAVTVRTLEDEAPSRPAATMGGRAYLEQQLDRRDRERRRVDERERDRQELHASLAGTAVDAVIVRDRPLEDDPPLLHGVYLVDGSGEARLEATVEHLAEQRRDLHFELTGPWPAYHFTSLELDRSGTG